MLKIYLRKNNKNTQVLQILQKHYNLITIIKKILKIFIQGGILKIVKPKRRNYMKNKSKKKNLLLVLLILLIVGIAVGYAGFAQTLTINGTANLKSDWNIHINSITEGDLVGATTVKAEATHGAVAATFEVDLEYPGASASYIVEVHNDGSVPAKIDSITGNLDTVNAAEPTGLTFTCDAAVGDTLDAGETKTYTVTATWSADDTSIPTTTTKTVTIELNYVQNTINE